MPRFSIGDEVHVDTRRGGWYDGKVVGMAFIDEDGDLCPYRVSVHGGGLMIKVYKDDDKCIRAGYIGQTQLRFPVGHRVMCMVEGGRVSGRIVMHWWRSDDGQYPYQICLDRDGNESTKDRLIFAPRDDDSCVYSIDDGEGPNEAEVQTLALQEILCAEEEMEKIKKKKKAETAAAKKARKKERKRKKKATNGVDIKDLDAAYNNADNADNEGAEGAGASRGGGASSTGGETTCIVCFTNPKTHAAAPCGHLCACSDCSKRMSECPYCRGTAVMWMTVREV